MAELADLFATAGNTDTLVRWDALLEAVDRLPPALSEGERCGLLLALANGERIALDKWNAMVGARVFGAPEQTRLALPQNVRSVASEALRVRVSGSQSVISRHGAALASVTRGRVVIVPGIGKNGRVDQLLARGMPSAIAYALTLFFDGRRNFGGDLRLCQLEECGRFFFVVRQAAGRPRDTYCSDEHLTEAHRRQVRERVARHRARQARRSSR